ncbi:hypothetical protein BDW22DRAFT_1350173 [Trametopsis cervina]|nr:hypothetical protein BDW22DRAFT_1350173 [Trametopsis cervina]
MPPGATSLSHPAPSSSSPPPNASTSTLASVPQEMSPSPLSANSVHLTLQYISPPSQLDRPLPTYLLSKPLLQRHHFLQLSPENPAEYLSWPSETSSKAIDLLELWPPIVDDEPVAYPVQYTSDVENAYAHVALPPAGTDAEAVRLVFQWDVDSWKFHDIKLMPFPQGSSVSLQDVLAGSPPTPGSAGTSVSPQYNPYGFDHDDEDNDDDDYWNAYGADDDDAAPREFQATKGAAADSEDAYWERYSSVHGTADSTIPTPPVVRRKQMYPYADQDSQDPLPVPARLGASDAFEDAVPIPTMLNVPPQWVHNPRWDPASPQALARLLADISPRMSPPQNAAVVADFEDDFGLSPPLEGSSDDSDTLSPPDVLGLNPTSALEDQKEALAPNALGLEEGIESATPVFEEEEPLRQSLKGLFALWKMSRSQKGITSEEADRTSFMRIVGEVVDA